MTKPKNIAINVAIVALAFVVNTLAVRLSYDQPTQSFWTFGFSLYSLSIGGGPWDAVFEAAPEIAHGVSLEASARAFQLAAHNIVHNPLPLFSGLAKSLKFYLFEGGIRFFIPSNAIGILFQISLPLAMVLCLARRDKYNREIFINGLALLFSLAFLLDGAYRARVLAGALPLYALVSVRGLAPLQRLLPSIRTEKPSPDLLFTIAMAVLGAVLAIMCFAFI